MIYCILKIACQPKEIFHDVLWTWTWIMFTSVYDVCINSQLIILNYIQTDWRGNPFDHLYKHSIFLSCILWSAGYKSGIRMENPASDGKKSELSCSQVVSGNQFGAHPLFQPSVPLLEKNSLPIFYHILLLKPELLMGKLHQDHQTRVTILVVDCIILYHIVSHIIELDDGKILTGNPNIYIWW